MTVAEIAKRKREMTESLNSSWWVLWQLRGNLLIGDTIELLMSYDYGIEAAERSR